MSMKDFYSAQEDGFQAYWFEGTGQGQGHHLDAWLRDE